jgi:hypothetical protein
MSKKPPKGLGLQRTAPSPGSFAAEDAPRIRRAGIHDRRGHGARAFACSACCRAAARAQRPVLRHQCAADALRHHAGAGKIPFICFDLAGGGNIAGSNVLVGGPKGQLDFLSVAGYSKLGLPGTMVPNSSATGNFIDSDLRVAVSHR